MYTVLSCTNNVPVKYMNEYKYQLHTLSYYEFCFYLHLFIFKSFYQYVTSEERYVSCTMCNLCFYLSQLNYRDL